MSQRAWAIAAAIAALAFGIAGAVAWATLAEPAYWIMRDNGMIMDEPASLGRFGTVITFIAVGVVAGVLLGIGGTLSAPRPGILAVVSLTLFAVVASLIAWQLGMILGPPDPATVTGSATGDHVPEELVVDTIAAFIVWPAAALVGILVASPFLRSDDDYTFTGRSVPPPQPSA